jgi:hypothetical protein
MFESLQNLVMPHWHQLVQQAGTNTRLRWMLWAIVYIFLIFIALSLAEVRQKQARTITQLQRTAERLEQLESQTDWPQRLAGEQTAAIQLRKRFWMANTPGLAEADLQNYLRGLANEQSGDGLRLRLAPTESISIGDVTLFKVSADMSVMINPLRINSFIKSMANDSRILVVDRFGYGAQRSGQVNILVTAYFLPSAPAGGDDVNAP